MSLFDPRRKGSIVLFDYDKRQWHTHNFLIDRTFQRALFATLERPSLNKTYPELWRTVIDSTERFLARERNA